MTLPAARRRPVHRPGRHRSAIVLALWGSGLTLPAGLHGCGQVRWPHWSGSAPGKPQPLPVEPWTILCVELYGERRRSSVDALAKGLGQASGFNRRLVRVEHTEEASRLYYGRYGRTNNPRTGMLEVPAELAADLRRLQQLALGIGEAAYPFLMATPVPLETEPVGPPEWDLRQADASHSLLIAVFAGVEDRRQVAVEYVRRLRQEGDEAYYYHDATRSHVCLGSFQSRDVKLLPNGLLWVKDPDYHRYRKNYPYYTLDGQYVSQVQRDATRRVVGKVRQPSTLVEIPR